MILANSRRFISFVFFSLLALNPPESSSVNQSNPEEARPLSRILKALINNLAFAFSLGFILFFFPRRSFSWSLAACRAGKTKIGRRCKHCHSHPRPRQNARRPSYERHLRLRISNTDGKARWLPATALGRKNRTKANRRKHTVFQRWSSLQGRQLKCLLQSSEAGSERKR